MKYYIKSLLALIPCLLLFVACDESSVEEESSQSRYSLEISLSSISDSEITIETTTDSQMGNYFVGVIPKVDNSNIDLQSQALSLLSSVNNLDCESVDNQYIFDGDSNIVLGEQWEISAQNDYIVLAFGIDASGEFITSNIASLSVTTTGSEEVLEELTSVKISVVEVSDKTIVISTQADEQVESYMIGIATLSDYVSIYNYNTRALAEDQASSIDLDNIDNIYLYSGDYEIDLSEIYSLTSYTDYIIYSAVVNSDGTLGSIISEVASTDINKSDYTIAASVEECGANHITIAVDPANYTGYYYVGLCLTDDYSSIYGSNPDTLAEAMVDAEISRGEIIFTIVDNQWVFSGNRDIDLGDSWDILPIEDYTIAIFGISGVDGQIATQVSTLSATTSEPEIDEDLAIKVIVSSVDYNDALANFEPNDDEIEYFYALYTAEEIANFEGSDEAIMRAMLAGHNSVASQTTTGDYKVMLEELTPSTAYQMVAFAIYEGYPISRLNYQKFTTAAEITSDDHCENGDIEIEVVNTLMDDILISVDTKGYTGNYFVGVYQMDYYLDTFDGNPALAANQLILDARSHYVKVYQTDDEVIFNGSKDEISLSEGWWDLEQLTEYAIIVFGVEGYNPDIVTSYTVKSATTRSLSYGQDIYIPNVDFGELTVYDPTSVGFTYTIEPNEQNMTYATLTLSEESYLKTGGTDVGLVRYAVLIYEDSADAMGVDPSAIMSWYLVKGDRTNTSTTRDPDTNYYMTVFGFDATTMSPLTEVKVCPISTLPDDGSSQSSAYSPAADIFRGALVNDEALIFSDVMRNYYSKYRSTTGDGSYVLPQKIVTSTLKSREIFPKKISM